MKEPSVTIQMIADVIPSNAIAGDSIAAGVIIADCGTLKPKLFNSSTEVLKEFTKSGQLTRKSDITLIHAAAIADIMPVLLKRSYNDDGTRAGFGVYKNKIASGTTKAGSLIDLATSIDKDVKYDLLNSSSSEIAKISFRGDNLSSGETGTTFEEVTLYPNSKFNHVELSGTDFTKFSYAYITNELGEETYLEYSKISTNQDQNIVKLECGDRSNTDSITIVFTEDVLATSISYIFNSYNTYENVLVKNGEVLRYKQNLTFTSDPIDPITFKIVAAGKLFYNDTQPEPTVPSGDNLELVAIEGIDRKSSTRDLIDAINKQLKTSFIDYNGTVNAILYSETSQSSSSSYTGTYDNSLGESTSVLNPSGNGFSILLYSNSPASIDFTAKINPNIDDEELIDVTVVTASRTYEYSGSTDPEYVNSYGANQFIENINDYDGIPFTIKVVINSGEYTPAKDVLTTPTVAFGKMNINLAENVSFRKAALEEIVDQDEVKIAYLCPFGYPNNAYLTKLTTYNTKIWAYTPIGLYCYKDDPEAIIATKPAISSEYAIFLAPHDKSTSMTDWIVDMSLEVAYLQKVQSNAAKGCEFAPMLGKENATFQVTKPSVVFKKSTREKLLDARIMSLITRTSQGINYLNKNKCTGGDTVLSEDQNARLACKINRDLDVLLEPIIGRYNTEETRSRVVTTINNYFAQNITNQVFSIDSFEVVCDESNNPPQVRANNQLIIDLKVTYLNAIYDILVYHRALNVASNNE